MRDLVGWNLSLGRWGGVQVRVHVFFVLLAIVAIHLSVIFDPHGALVADAAVTLAILFVSVLLHELGHCYAAHRLGARVDQIVIWPLGGLVPVNLSHQPHEELVTAASGLAVSTAIAVLAAPAVMLSGQDVWPLFNPLEAPISPDGVTWPYCLQLVLWLNWLLTLVNLLPAYPLDGGRVLRSLVWQSKGYRTAVVVVSRVAIVTAVLTWIGAWVVHSRYPHASLPLALLGVLLYFSAKQESDRLQDRDADEGYFGYDFSHGYSSLDNELDAPPRRPVGLIRQWLDNRRQARLLRLKKRDDDDDRRVDDVLARLHQRGRDALSEEDRALLDRVSARYRNRQRG